MAINKNKVIAAAQKYVQKGQIEKAIREYRRVVEEEPGDVRTWLKIGDLQAKKGETEQATETYLRVANHYSEEGFFLKAVAVYKQVVRLNPRFVDVHLKLAALNKQLGLVSDARRQLEVAYKVLMEDERAEDALEVLKATVELDPENVAMRIRLAETYSREKRVEDAVAEFHRAADILRMTGRTDDFIRVAERLIWHTSEDVGLLKELSALYLRRGDPRRALQKLQICYKADDKDAECLNLLADAFVALEQKAKAVTILKVLATVHEEKDELVHRDDVFRRILSLEPEDPEALEALSELEQEDREMEALQEAPEPEPSPEADAAPEVEAVPDAEVLEIDDLEELGEIEELDEEAELDEVANQIATLYGEAEVYEKFGLMAEAVEQLEKAKQLDPDNPETQQRLKKVYVQLGRISEAVNAIMVVAAQKIDVDPEEARTLLQEALVIDPENRRVQDMLAEIPGERRRERRSSAHLAARWQASDSDVQILDDIAEEAYAEEPVYATEEIDFGELEQEIDQQRSGPRRRFAPVATAHEVILDAEGRPQPDGLEYLEDELDTGDLRGEVDLLLDPMGEGGQPGAGEEMEVDLAAMTESIEPDVGFSPMDPWEAPGDEIDPSMEPGGEAPDTAVVERDELERLAGALEVEEMEEPLDLERGSVGDIVGDDPFEDELSQLKEAEELVASLHADDVVELGAAEEPWESEFSDIGTTLGLDGEGSTEAFGAALEAEAADQGAGDQVALEAPSEHGQQEPPPHEDLPDELAEEMEEADFFIDQGLYEDALGMLRDLAAEHGEHAALMEKIAAVKAQMQDEGDLGELEQRAEGPEDAEPGERGPRSRVPRHESDAFSQFKEGVAKQVGEDDADTHFDVGIAYREMGMYKDAIGEFQASMRPHNEVQCHLMIAQCFRDMGQLSDAVNQYKKALYCEKISDNEQVDIYYQMGIAYEDLRDAREALYYYEKVERLLAGYRDTEERLERIRAEAGPARSSAPESETAGDSEPPGQDGKR